MSTSTRDGGLSHHSKNRNRNRSRSRSHEYKHDSRQTRSNLTDNDRHRKSRDHSRDRSSHRSEISRHHDRKREHSHHAVHQNRLSRDQSHSREQISSSKKSHRHGQTHERSRSRDRIELKSNYPSKRNDSKYSTSEKNQYEDQPSSETVLLRYIPDSITERDIVQHLSQHNLQARDIRIVKKPSSDGHVKCMCFVEFPNSLCAEMWMKNTKAIVNLNGQVASLSYSASKNDANLLLSSSSGLLNKNDNNFDWYCSNCEIQNYRWRKECFKCHSLKENVRSRPLDSMVYIGKNPCNTLVVSQLDSLTDENSLMSSFKSTNSSLRFKSIYIHRDPNTNESFCFGFVEFDNVKIAANVLHNLLSSALECDGKIVDVNFCKNNFATMILEITSNSVTNSSAAEIIQKSRLLASGLPDSDYYDATKSYIASMNNTSSKSSHSSSINFPIPDMTDKKFDEKTGYYFDNTTGLYYEPRSKLFFNPLSKQFLIYDYKLNQYKVAPNSIQIYSKLNNDEQNPQQTLSATTYTAVVPSVNKNIDIDSESEIKVSDQVIDDIPENFMIDNNASKIAKDMEKWAKRQNFRSTVINVSQNSSNISGTPTSVLQMKNDMPNRLNEDQPFISFLSSSMPNQNLNSLFSHQKPFDEHKSTSYIENNDSNIDKINLNCLLCQRHFKSLDILLKHVKKSKLHADNLSKL